jgi:hypothetical protein
MRHLRSTKSLPTSLFTSSFFLLPSIDAKTAAKTLGYDEKSWDKDRDTDATEKEWKALSSKEKQAAATLGYDEATWNVESSSSSDDN